MHISSYEPKDSSASLLCQELYSIIDLQVPDISREHSIPRNHVFIWDPDKLPSSLQKLTISLQIGIPLIQHLGLESDKRPFGNQHFISNDRIELSFQILKFILVFEFLNFKWNPNSQTSYLIKSRISNEIHVSKQSIINTKQKPNHQSPRTHQSLSSMKLCLSQAFPQENLKPWAFHHSANNQQALHRSNTSLAFSIFPLLV